MRLRTAMAALAALLMPGCGLVDQLSGPPTAQSVCTQLMEARIGQNCRRVVPDGVGARARERWQFDLISVPGQGGYVHSFDTDEDYDWTVRIHADNAILVGAHRYGNRDRRIFVQFNRGAPVEVGDRVRAIVEGL